MMPRIELHRLSDDGLVPNNDRVPLVVYRGALAAETCTDSHFEALFARHGWSNAWVNGIYPFHHYHATVHEVLGLARGRADVQFGGPSGPIVPVAAGDAVLIPAGVGHCRRSASRDLCVVGAYPGGADWDLVRAIPEARAAALALLARVPPPSTDPVLGGPFDCAVLSRAAGA
ncbi:MAG: cupin [Hyphomicrobiaceae bacterium]